MSRYEDYAWDNLSEEIEEFLKNHTISDLLKIITYIVEIKEEA